MSTLVAQTLSNGSVSTSTANCIQGSAKAWVNFNGSSAAINGSYNVSSITKNGSGDYTVNMTNAMANTSYAPLATCGNASSPDRWAAILETSTTTSAYRLNTKNGGASNYDVAQVYTAVFR